MSQDSENDWLKEFPSRSDTRSGPQFGLQPMEPSDRKSRQIAWERPSIGRRMFRFVTRFTIAVLIGVGATLGWQSYGEVAGQMLVAQAPTLAWLVPMSTPKPPSAATRSTPTQQLEPMAANLSAMRRDMDQLAARQDEMAQRIAALRAFEEEIRQKISLMPPFSASASQAAPIPQQKPAKPKAPSPTVQPSSVPHPRSPSVGD
jgi:hypothetical protein